MTTETLSNNGILVNVKFREEFNSELRIYSQECNFCSEVHDTVMELFEKIANEYIENEYELPLFDTDFLIDIIDLTGTVKPLVNQSFKELIKIGINSSMLAHSWEIL